MPLSLKSFFSSKPVSTTYDSYNHETSAILAKSDFSGIKSEISKTIFPFLQISTISNFNKNKPVVQQYFSTFSFKNAIFQFCTDNNRGYQLKSSFIIGPLINKIHSIVSSKKEVYTQFESMYGSKFFNLGLRIISPTFEASNLIYIFNFWRCLGNACFGMEVVGMDKEIGISVSSRIEVKDSVCCISLQRLNLLTLSLYKRIFGNLELGAECKANTSSVISYGAGLRIRNGKTDFKLNIDQNLSARMIWDEKLTENFAINFSSIYDEEGFNYGVGFMYES